MPIIKHQSVAIYNWAAQANRLIYASTDAPKAPEQAPDGKPNAQAEQDKANREYVQTFKTAKAKVEAAQRDPNPAVQEAARIAQERLQKLDPSLEQKQNTIAEISRILNFYENILPEYTRESQALKIKTETEIKNRQLAISQDLSKYEETHRLNKDILFLFRKLESDTYKNIEDSANEILSKSTQKPAPGDLESYMEGIYRGLNEIKAAPDEMDEALTKISLDYTAKRDSIVIDYASKQTEQSKIYLENEFDLAQKAIAAGKNFTEDPTLMQRLKEAYENAMRQLDVSMDSKARGMILAEFTSTKDSLIRKANGETSQQADVMQETAKRVKLDESISVSAINRGFIVSEDQNVRPLAESGRAMSLRPGTVEFRSESGAVITVLKPTQKVQILDYHQYEIRTGQTYESGEEKTIAFYRVKVLPEGIIGLVRGEKIDFRGGGAATPKSTDAAPQGPALST